MSDIRDEKKSPRLLNEEDMLSVNGGSIDPVYCIVCGTIFYNSLDIAKHHNSYPTHGFDFACNRDPKKYMP